MSEDTVLLQMKDITKTFGGIHALQNVHFELKEGEVHALLGENGAGKSTLMNILSGALPPDSGDIILDGRKITVRNPLAAMNMGIVKVHQEIQVIPEMTAAANIFLGSEPMKNGVVDFKSMNRKAQDYLDGLNVDFKSTEQCKHLSTAQNQMVEIAKALRQNFRILILDEPTSSLSDNEIEKLFATVLDLKKQGKSIIYISHRLEEIFSVADRATVFRDGQYIDTKEVAGIQQSDLVKLMVGRDIEDVFEKRNTEKDEVVLEVKHVSDGGKSKDVSFDLRKGEILGISGLVGAGRTETARAIFGASKMLTGEVRLHGKPVQIKSPAQAIASGIMLIPEDRKLQGIVSERTVQQNIVLGNLRKYCKALVLNFGRIKKSVAKLSDELDINPRNQNLPVKNLSGGNQQKVVVAKALDMVPSILILDEPTRGIDVNAKNEIYHLMKRLADSGMSLIMISSELPEILRMSDRIVVMWEGKVTGIIPGEGATEEKVMHLAMGENYNG
jgi:ribose transport system ATP-binding protein